MKIKRGILIGVALYVATMIVGIILTIFAQSSLSSPQSMPTTYWIITIVVTVVLTSLASIWYFAKAKRTTLEGLKLGITFVIVGFILDLILFLTQSGGIEVMKEYYSNISFYIVLLLVVASAVFIGSRVHHTAVEETPKAHRKHKKK
jgi:uncharacterized membrane protein YfcA